MPLKRNKNELHSRSGDEDAGAVTKNDDDDIDDRQ